MVKTNSKIPTTPVASSEIVLPPSRRVRFREKKKGIANLVSPRIILFFFSTGFGKEAFISKSRSSTSHITNPTGVSYGDL